ncbi:uncharacterized protein LOC110450158 [Mizuhopecten yessoensis]|uniref:Uncharacterized protein n=1 Tax=Mizuhopecten yessoensis TaxID=6573 RepID=A0A210QPJ1_MIZYE|nr:uncharacterized protein LOC110450158 [Mizuhopecten yessoensis]XP_021353118.1 uncharacterized protein LOC110450158 [Mizuhopecten yessoensis]OWF50650.1 hypothetical protein KP79_PYT18237 [Mizuhopecten yessoensis]
MEHGSSKMPGTQNNATGNIMAPRVASNDQQTPGKGGVSLSYMHGPPRIMPNYGNKRRSLLPKTKVSRVLLYDNITQQQMLDVKLSHIKLEKNRTTRLLDLHKRSFLLRQQKRQQQMQQVGVVLPEIDHPNKKQDILTRLTSQYSKRSVSSIGGRRSVTSAELETLKLPDLEISSNEHNNPHVIFKIKNASGITQIFHTIDNEGVFSDIVPLYKFYDKTTEDPRFQSLEGSLVRTAVSTDGFNELSASFKKEYPKFPVHLQEFIDENHAFGSSV